MFNRLDPGGTKRESLARMYQPPRHLMTDGTLDEIKNLAESTHRFVLVNVQDMNEFACNVLNRDVWSDERVARAVRESFVFWQIPHASEAGAYFCTLYQVTSFPYLAILYPQTGAVAKVWETPPSADQLVDDLGAFVRSVLEPQQESTIIDATEDEQLKAAIQASLAASTASGTETVISLDDDDDDDDDTGAIAISGSDSDSDVVIIVPDDDDEDDDDDNEDDGDEDNINDAGGDQAAGVEVLPPEPAAGTPDTTRIKFVFPDGTSLVRRFALDSPVRHLFVFAAAAPGAPSGLDLVVPPRSSLSSERERSLADAGIRNAMIRVVTS